MTTAVSGETPDDTEPSTPDICVLCSAPSSIRRYMFGGEKGTGMVCNECATILAQQIPYLDALHGVLTVPLTMH